MPHAPALLPSLSGSAPAAAANVRRAVESLSWRDVSLLVILSPHGARTGVYRAAAGSLDGFGVPGVSASYRVDEEAGRALARAWDRPLVDEPIDHGALVALMLLRPRVPVVAAALAEVTPGDAKGVARAAAEATAFVAALRDVGSDAGLVSSCNTGAGLSPRAPLTEVPEAVALEGKLLDGLAQDAAVARELAVDLGRAGSCAGGPLSAFGLAFGGAPARTVAYECPLGVGYPVVAAGEA